jgi:hypothetical protein
MINVTESFPEFMELRLEAVKPHLCFFQLAVSPYFLAFERGGGSKRVDEGPSNPAMLGTRKIKMPDYQGHAPGVRF